MIVITRAENSALIADSMYSLRVITFSSTLNHAAFFLVKTTNNNHSSLKVFVGCANAQKKLTLKSNVMLDHCSDNPSYKMQNNIVTAA